MQSPKNFYPPDWFNDSTDRKSKNLPMRDKGTATASARARATAKACRYTVTVLASGCRLFEMSSCGQESENFASP
jgi:hypothetical protein